MENDVEEREVSALDLLLVVGRNLKLLLFGPVLAGLLAFAIASSLPQSFNSYAILILPAPAPTAPSQSPALALPLTLTPAMGASMMSSPAVLDPVIKAMHLSDGTPTDSMRAKLAQQIKATASKDGLLRLEVTATTPKEAQLVASAVIDTFLASTVPGEQDRADLEKRYAHAKLSLESINGFLGRLGAGDATSLTKPLTRADAGITIAAVGELQARYLNEVLNIPRISKGLSREVVKQAPTLPTEPSGPKRSLIAMLAGFFGGLTLLVWVFLRNAWQKAAQDTLSAKKQTELLTLVGFGSRLR